jgi:hypothetical protein
MDTWPLVQHTARAFFKRGHHVSGRHINCTDIMTRGNDAPPNARALSFGLRAQDGANQMYGQLDDIRIWNRALSASEVVDLYCSEAAFTPPTITQQPSPQTVLAGTNVLLSVTALGSAPLSYQRMKNDLPLDGATGSSYAIPSSQVTDSGLYAVVVTNLYGSATSSPAKLWVTTNAFDLALLAYYPFNGNANDETGNGHTGTPSSAVPTTDRFEKPDAAFAFDGVSSVITVPHSDVFNFPNNTDFAISLWAVLNTPTEVSPQFYLMGKNTGRTKWVFGHGGTAEYQTIRTLYFHINSPSLPYNGVWLGDGKVYTVESNRWHQYMINKVGSTYSIYVDGKLLASDD